MGGRNGININLMQKQGVEMALIKKLKKIKINLYKNYKNNIIM